MIIVLAHCGNGYVGCDVEDVFFYEEGTDYCVIDSDVYNWARGNAEAFVHYYFTRDKEEYTDEEWEDYIEDYVEFDWHEATHGEYLKWCRDYLCAEPNEI